MYVGNEDTATQTLITYVGNLAGHSSYTAAKILFADNFDMASLPKSVRAHRLMTVNCTPTKGNEKNESGIKRLRRILKALEGTPVKVLMSSANSITEEEFFALAT